MAKRLERSTGLALALCCASAVPAFAAQAPGTAFETGAIGFLSKNCYGCHSENLASGKLNLQAFRTGASILPDRERWERVIGKIRSGEMPPPAMPRPDAIEAKTAVAAIEEEFDKFDRQSQPDPGRVTVRRLNRTEYNNTVRDLLAVDFRPADDFPPDNSGYGFDNIGDVLSLSPLLMEKYLAAAAKIARRAVYGMEPLKPSLVKHQPWYIDFDLGKEVKFDYDLTGLSLPSSLHVMHRFPVDGEYILSGELRGFRSAQADPVKMAFWLDGAMIHTAEVEIPKSGEVSGQHREFRLRVPAGEHWLAVSLLRYFEGLPPAFRGPNPSKKPPQAAVASLPKDKDQRPGPSAGFFVNNLTVFGPHEQTRGRSEASRRLIFTCGHAEGNHNPGCDRKILTNLARRAYRRPPTRREIDSLVSFAARVRRQGDSFEESICLAIQKLLISPHFLFRIERAGWSRDRAALGNHELASRLSYFLWSSMPDEELLRIADQGALRRAGVLEAQVRRMLADRRSRALVEDFGGQWLQFRALESHKPERKVFQAYTDYTRMSMQRETEMFFEHIIREDRSVLDFLDAHYTFLNQRMAEFYGIPGIEGHQFRKVDLKGTQRRGVLTHASVLTVSSYATRTSPVLRGKWILDNLLNAPPPPPPADVPGVDEAAIGSTQTLREQLEKHRSNATCASCHARMDPLGFGLENFDAIGAWRTHEGKLPIDASGSLPDGRSFTAPVELAAILSGDRDAFAECISEKLLIYALGRGLQVHDRPAVKRIARGLAANGYKFSSLILEIVNSVPFQYRGPEPVLKAQRR